MFILHFSNRFLCISSLELGQVGSELCTISDIRTVPGLEFWFRGTSSRVGRNSLNSSVVQLFGEREPNLSGDDSVNGICSSEEKYGCSLLTFGQNRIGNHGSVGS